MHSPSLPPLSLPLALPPSFLYIIHFPVAHRTVVYEYRRIFNGVDSVVNASEVPTSLLADVQIVTTEDCPSGPWQVILCWCIPNNKLQNYCIFCQVSVI